MKGLGEKVMTFLENLYLWRKSHVFRVTRPWRKTGSTQKGTGHVY